jgi:putative hydrolase of the HAD superfamily
MSDQPTPSSGDDPTQPESPPRESSRPESEHEKSALDNAARLAPGQEPLTAEEKEAFLSRARAQGRTLTSEEQYAIFGPAPKKVEEFRSSEVVEEMEAAQLGDDDLRRLSEDFFADVGGAAAPPRLVQALIFDFDQTLAALSRPQQELLEQGAADALAYMRSRGMDLPDEIAGHLVDARRFAEEKSEEENEEHLADDALTFLLQFFGFPTSRMDPETLQRAVEIFYAPEAAAWQLRPGARALLNRLRAEGYRLALMTHFNADRVFQRVVDQLGLRLYFDIVLSSSAIEYRKPDPRYFQVAIDHWQLMPYEVVVVGDSLKHDVAGALETGSLSILVTDPTGAFADPQVTHDNTELAGQVQPDAVVASLDEILAHIHAWS